MKVLHVGGPNWGDSDLHRRTCTLSGKPANATKRYLPLTQDHKLQVETTEACVLTTYKRVWPHVTSLWPLRRRYESLSPPHAGYPAPSQQFCRCGGKVAILGLSQKQS